MLLALVALSIAGTVAWLPSHPARALPPETVPAETTAALASVGIRVEQRPSGYIPRISRDQAIDAAAGPLARTDPSIAAFLVSFTDDAYGSVIDERQGAITPAWEDQPAWLILEKNRQVPLLCCPGQPGERQYYAAAVEIFIDAETGDFLKAIAIGMSIQTGVGS